MAKGDTCEKMNMCQISLSPAHVACLFQNNLPNNNSNNVRKLGRTLNAGMKCTPILMSVWQLPRRNVYRLCRKQSYFSGKTFICSQRPYAYFPGGERGHFQREGNDTACSSLGPDHKFFFSSFRCDRISGLTWTTRYSWV